MRIAFDEEDKRYKAYGVVDISVKGEIRELSESELNNLVPDGFEGNWKKNKRHFKLKDGEVVFDETYEPQGA